MDKLAATVDMALKSYDENDDGYIYYGEFYRYLFQIYFLSDYVLFTINLAIEYI